MPGDSAADFLTNPVAWADPMRAAAALASLLAPGVQPVTAARLLASPRLAQRASRFLASRLGTGNLSDLEFPDRELALAPGATLDVVAAAAGAVWHGQRIRALVFAPEIAAFAARHGTEARNAALRHAALSPIQERSAGEDHRALADVVALDGARCMAAWIAALPEWVGARVRLKWTGNATPPGGAAERDRAVEIVRAVATDELLG